MHAGRADDTTAMKKGEPMPETTSRVIKCEESPQRLPEPPPFTSLIFVPRKAAARIIATGMIHWSRIVITKPIPVAPTPKAR